MQFDKTTIYKPLPIPVPPLGFEAVCCSWGILSSLSWRQWLSRLYSRDWNEGHDPETQLEWFRIRIKIRINYNACLGRNQTRWASEFVQICNQKTGGDQFTEYMSINFRGEAIR